MATRHTLTRFGDWSGPDSQVPLAHEALWSECPTGKGDISRISLREYGQVDQTPDYFLLSCPKYAETSAKMAARCRSGDYDVGFGKGPLLHGWLCSINIHEDGMWLPQWLELNKKTIRYAKISPKMVHPRDIAGEHRRRSGINLIEGLTRTAVDRRGRRSFSFH